MKIIDALTELLFDPNVGANKNRPQGETAPSSSERSFARGGVLYRSRKIQTVEELEAERAKLRKSLNRTDY